MKDSKEENEISIKRKSYRQKVKDFKTNKLKPENSTKIPKNNKNLEIIKKQENQEKNKVGGLNNFAQTIFLILLLLQ